MPLYRARYSVSSGREIREHIQGPSAELVRGRWFRVATPRTNKKNNSTDNMHPAK